MSGKKNLAQAKAARARVIKVAPVTRAVRLALAATTLALAGTGAAYAGTCSTAGNTTQCTGVFTDTISYPDAIDLTLVIGDGSTPTSVTPASGAAGIDVAGDGAIDISSFADITTYGADGIHAYSSGSLGVTNDGTITTYVTGPGQEGIDAIANGDLDVTNNGRVGAIAYGVYDATAVRAESDGCGCTVTVENSGGAAIGAYASYGSAIGVYAYAATGTVRVGNDGSIDAYSRYGLADGVFAAGQDVGVRNGGEIYAVGYGWAAGIEAEGSDVVEVRNGGEIYAYANGYTGHAYGIYAVGGADGATVDQLGLVRVAGAYATGVSATALGNVAVTNAGDIEVGSPWTAYATGIHAGSNGEGGVVSVTNDGFVGAYSYFSATGIEVVATGTGASASVGNSGTVYAGTVNNSPYSKYGSAVGIVVSADGDANIDNSGAIYVSQAVYGGEVPLFSGEGFQPYYGGTAYGAMALSFNGDASITNSGGIQVIADDFGYAVGALAASQNGNASVGNSGAVQSQGKYAYGVLATSGAGDVSVDNDATGEVRALSLNGLPYAFAAALGGIATQGDATIDNAGYALAISYGTAIGMFGIAGQGDVNESNSGDIISVAYQTAIGTFARADYGTAAVTSTGSISAYAYAEGGDAVGMFARSDYGTASVDNGGDILAVSYAGTASGIRASGATVDVANTGDIALYAYQSGYGIEVVGGDQATIDNDGSLYVSSLTGAAFGVLGASASGDVSIGGAGTIAAYGPQAAFGVYAYASAGSVSVHNDGAIYVGSSSGLADGIFAAGANVDVASSGSIVANGYSWAAGIEARGDVVSAENSGDVSVQASNGYAFGVYAYGATSAHAGNSGAITVTGPEQAVGMAAFGGGDAGVATASNSGSLYATASSKYGVATGILAGGDGGASVTNAGDINVSAGTAVGIRAGSLYGDVFVGNDGTITANGAKYAYGVLATSENGDVAIHTGADAEVHAIGTLRSYGVIGYASQGDLSIDNGGLVYAIGIQDAFAIYGGSGAGDVSLSNSGDVIASSGFGGAFGMYASAESGTATVANAGAVHAYSTARGAVGIAAFGDTTALSNSGSVVAHAYSEYYGGGEYGPGFGPAIGLLSYGGSVDVGNAGDISAYAFGNGLGIVAVGGSVHVDNGGAIVAESVYADARGITAYGANVAVDSSGSIDVSTAHGAYVQGIYAGGGTVAVANGGAITAASGEAGFVQGIAAYGDGVSVDNAGSIAAQGSAVVAGIVAVGGETVSLDNAGTITATVDGDADSLAVGASVFSYGEAALSNSGTISAVSNGDGQAIGVLVQGNGVVTVDNAGTITATDPGYAVAVGLYAAGSVFTNAGTVRSNAGGEGRIAVRGGDGIEHVLNYGQLDGALVLNGGDDLLFNGAVGTWTVANQATDFGDGDDALVNNGTIQLRDGAISLGGSAEEGNSFINAGHIQVFGTGNLIDMGTGPATALVPSTNPVALANNGVIDFVDGAPDDVLTINGDLGGSGALNIDLRPLTGASDLLYVDGNVASGAVQTVNVDFGGSLTTDLLDSTTQFASVSGNSGAGSFVGGQVLGWSATDFIDLQVNVTSQIDASGAASDVFSVGVAAVGLTDPGTLAASIAPGAQSLVNAQVGTWRQRMGVQPGNGTIGLSPWLRMFGDAGDVRPGHVASNFGTGGNFDFQQSNTGWELGLNTRPNEHLNLGVLVAKSEGHQHLDDGAGTSYLDGRTFGVYATWIADRFYVDASMRWMGFDADLRSAGARQRTDGSADAFNIEAGFNGWNVAGLNLQPQVQYTHTRVSDIRPLRGDVAVFDAGSAGSSRGRVGLAVDKTFAAGGWTLTPYGSLNAIREFDGKYGYNVDDVFFGSTSTEGTSALVELGMGARKDKLSVTGGVNWTDGGALNSVFGGQVVVRYNW